MNKQLEIIEKLYQKPINGVWFDALWNGKAEIIEQLIKAKFDVNIDMGFGDSSLKVVIKRIKASEGFIFIGQPDTRT